MALEPVNQLVLQRPDGALSATSLSEVVITCQKRRGGDVDTLLFEACEQGVLWQ